MNFVLEDGETYTIRLTIQQIDPFLNVIILRCNLYYIQIWHHTYRVLDSFIDF